MLGREDLRCSFRSRQYLQVQPFAAVSAITTHFRFSAQATLTVQSPTRATTSTVPPRAST